MFEGQSLTLEILTAIRWFILYYVPSVQALAMRKVLLLRLQAMEVVKSHTFE